MISSVSVAMETGCCNKRTDVVASHGFLDVNVTVRARRCRVLQPFQVRPLFVATSSKTRKVCLAIPLLKLPALVGSFGECHVFIYERVCDRKRTVGDWSVPCTSAECTE
jgi:hypothetical protein